MPFLDFKKIAKKLNKDTISFKQKHPETKNNYYPEELVKIFEEHIALYGHAYCMDVASERKKISKLMYKLLNENLR